MTIRTTIIFIISGVLLFISTTYGANPSAKVHSFACTDKANIHVPEILSTNAQSLF